MKFLLNILRKTKYFFWYYAYVIRNRRIDYFEYKKLAVNFPIFSTSNAPGIIGNKCYGNYRAVKRAMGKRFDKNCLIEHGLYFGEFVIEDDCKAKGLNTIYTFGEYRVNALRKSEIEKLRQIKIVPIGAYILNAKNFHTADKRRQIKQKYGNILLAFPYHTSPELDTDFDAQAFINEIKKVKETYSYDTVFVSIFWLDIVNENYRMYEKEGFVIVCSGVRNDPYFLSRQRDLIQLSDMTMSNDLGTHIGYCISLNRPHYYYNQEIIVNKIHTDDCEFSDKNREAKFAKEKLLFAPLFCSTEPIVTEEQRNIVRYYWGEGVKYDS